MDEFFSQNDLDALFGDIVAGTQQLEGAEEKSAVECAEGSENLSQDQIDELLKMYRS
ncbi:MAG TPA: hypothetical protein VMT62_05525 [Syntrophorhabdaceae bacterium]|nr:hypothetical protein [Syntrophorhabdaceae bacterium]